MTSSIDRNLGLIEETIDVPVGKKQTVDVHFVYPDPIEGLPEQIVLNAIGWTETPESIKPTLIHQALGGVAAATISHPRSSSPFEVLRAAKLRSERIAIVAEYLKVNFDFIGCNLTGHSLGGIDATRAVVENDLRPRSHMLIASAGLIKGDHLRTVAPRVFKEILKQEQHFRESFINETKFAAQSLSTVIKNPGLVVKEGVYAANHYAADMIGTIAENGAAVGVIIPRHDSIFPAHMVRDSLQGLAVDRIFEIEARHNPTYHNPDILASITVNFVQEAPNIVQSRNALGITQEDVEHDLFKRNS